MCPTPAAKTALSPYDTTSLVAHEADPVGLSVDNLVNGIRGGGGGNGPSNTRSSKAAADGIKTGFDSAGLVRAALRTDTVPINIPEKSKTFGVANKVFGPLGVAGSMLRRGQRGQ